ncbi:MAG: tripartite tricarboxylate transporter substrate binding protein [candidate division NC10 bacterium]|nr:tripartite tricarboxylate transporter substrate binding protein [candidate division NC10 bacterium]
MKRTRGIIAVAGLLGVMMAGAVLLASIAAAADWPARPIQVFAWASAGGDTDLTNRTIWGIVEDHLKATVTVSNTTGALGGLAATKVWGARRDGHTVLGMSEMLHPLPVVGAHPTTSKDWDVFVIGGGPGVISVRADSPYKTFEDFARAAQQNPGKITMGHCPPGCIWHVKGLLLTKYANLQFKFVPYKGSAPAVTAVLTGEVDSVSASLGEQLEFIRAGRLRPLITTERDPLDYEGIKLQAARAVLPGLEKAPEVFQWLGTAIPADTPDDIRTKWAEALKKAFASPKMQEVLKRRAMRPMGWEPKVSREKLAQADSVYMWLLQDLKLTVHSPETFGVPKP